MSIIHVSCLNYSAPSGTNRAKYCWKGNQMFADLDDDLHFGFQRNGSLVIALTEKEEEELRNLMLRGEKNGVQNLRILSREEVCSVSPPHPHLLTTLPLSGLPHGARYQPRHACRPVQS